MMVGKSGGTAAAVSSRSVAVFIVAVAFVVLSCCASDCLAGTVPNRPNVIRDSSGSGEKKTPATRRTADAAFANAGTRKGLEIWRIQNFNPVAVPASEFGKFFTGDSYIVLNTIEDNKKQLSWRIHYWLGLETTQDEAGAAAIHTVQLDDQLGGAPVQQRETQEQESALFRSYFKQGIRYAAGGHSSGMRHTETNAAGAKRLFQVKGKRDVRVREVALTVASMNRGDCFLLDNGRKIYVYVGPQAKRVEKLKAISAANQIRDQDHRGRATVEIVDEFSTDGDREQFFRELGGGATAADVPSDSEDDEQFERQDVATLYQVSDANGGAVKVTEVARTPLTQQMLKPEDCFILDGKTVIFVWVGSRATKAEKTKAMEYAQDFIQQKNYPRWTPVHRIIGQGETAPFKMYFTTWQDRGMSATRLVRSVATGAALEFAPDNGDNDAERDSNQELAARGA